MCAGRRPLVALPIASAQLLYRRGRSPGFNCDMAARSLTNQNLEVLGEPSMNGGGWCALWARRGRWRRCPGIEPLKSAADPVRTDPVWPDRAMAALPVERPSAH